MKLFNSTLHTKRQRKNNIKPDRIVDVEWMKKVKSLGCVVCRNLGMGWRYADAHHIRRGMDGQKLGMRQKAGDREVIPLCPDQHHWNGSLVNMPMSQFEELYGNELDLLAQVMKEMESAK